MTPVLGGRKEARRRSTTKINEKQEVCLQQPPEQGDGGGEGVHEKSRRFFAEVLPASSSEGKTTASKTLRGLSTSSPSPFKIRRVKMSTVVGRLWESSFMWPEKGPTTQKRRKKRTMEVR